ncbi:MAG: hypothetical protein IID05_12505, partial [Gemmatimonadetes bacterium]|nr:hypothetical protein [Gemmatimonadota bacterium]
HAFAKHKLLNPRIWDREKIKRPYDKLKMPNFYFDDEEAEALTTYLMSRVSPLVHDSLKVGTEGTRANAIARGRDLTRLLNCVGCHDIEDNAPTVQQYFRLKQSGQQVFDSVNAPPSLWGEGAKLQHPWFHDYLKNVEPLRPWLRIRMPSFNLTGDEATTLVEYFAALAQQDATNLHDEIAPISQYIAEAESKTDAAQDGATPGSDWYEQDTLRDNAANLRDWSLRRRLMRPGELDPVTTAPKRFKAAHAKLLVRAKFMSKLYDVSYPFVEPHRPLSSSERFELGGQFFNDMGCLKCHILGSMLPGPAKTTDDFVNVTVFLDRPPTLQEWTTIEVQAQDLSGNVIPNLGDLGPGIDEGDRVDIGALPDDVTQDGLVQPVDLTRWQQYYNGQTQPPKGEIALYIDTDRSGEIQPLDLLRFIQLFNGNGFATRVWLGEQMNNTRP